MSEQANASVADPFVGQTLSDRFLVQRIAGQTSDAITYTGVDQRTGSPVRIQRPAVFHADAETRSRLRSAGELIARAKGVPGVVAPITSGVHAGVPFLVLPPVLGGTLADRLAQLNGSVSGTAAARSIRVWLQPVAAILDSMHQLGVVHGRLTPEAIVFGAGNAPVIDGVPIRQMVAAVGGDATQLSEPRRHPYLAPEVVAGCPAEASSDQFSLAAIVKECLGHARFESGGRRSEATQVATDLPRAASKALASRPTDRFASCGAFADALVHEAEGVAQSPAKTNGTTPLDAPLELESPEITAPARGAAKRVTLPLEVPLELEEIESDAVRRAARKSQQPVDDDVDITLTKVGESLLTPKSTYDRARSLAATRSAWRRIREGYGDLNASRKWVARVAVTVLGIAIALWILQAGLRAVRYIAGVAQTAAKSVVDRVQPDVDALKASGGEFAQKMRDLWAEIRPADEQDELAVDEAAMPNLGREERQVDGGPWPGRVQDMLVTADLRDPSSLVTEILGYKGVTLTSDGLGAFHVDDPQNPNRPAWIGGFGIIKNPGAPRRPLLHGTVVHHEGETGMCVARYIRGSMKEFWRVSDREGRPVVAYTRVKMTGSSDMPKPDGAAFVLDTFRTSCLAFVFNKNRLVGGQWCKKTRDKEGYDAYLPPSEIASLAQLEAADNAFTESRAALDAMLAQLPYFQKQAVAALQSYVKGLRESGPAGAPE